MEPPPHDSGTVAVLRAIADLRKDIQNLDREIQGLKSPILPSRGGGSSHYLSLKKAAAYLDLTEKALRSRIDRGTVPRGATHESGDPTGSCARRSISWWRRRIGGSSRACGAGSSQRDSSLTMRVVCITVATA
jgi:hypothetical protein